MDMIHEVPDDPRKSQMCGEDAPDDDGAEPTVAQMITRLTNDFNRCYGETPKKLFLGRETARHLAREITAKTGIDVRYLQAGDVFHGLEIVLLGEAHKIRVGRFLHLDYEAPE